MNEAPRYLLERWTSEIKELFDESERADVLDWLIANHDRRRVVLVGAGFSRNARNPRSTLIPLWEDISKALAADLRVPADAFDALSLVDFHRRNQGESAFQQRLLSLLKDKKLEPGDAHEALWNSNPEAVITTNFLDTLLDEDPRSLPVIEDPDLALPVGKEQAQVIYLHGHRSNFQSWVAGRSDYDDLQDKRPMLFARTRQLFAQFPLLVVGYSLTDPDFHLVYRQMVRAMNLRHPMGLAVVLPRNGESAEQAERAAKKYWEDLGLRIVRFKRGGLSSEEAFVRFFKLTRRVEGWKDIARSYRSPETSLDVARTFAANVAIMESAFRDDSLDRVWAGAFSARASFWADAISKALPEVFDEGASGKARTFNLRRFHRPRTQDGTASPLTPDSEPNHPEELVHLKYAEAEQVESSLAESWRLLSDQRGSTFVWKLEALLDRGVDREVLATWLRAAVRPEILDEPMIDVRAISCALLLLSEHRATDEHLLRELVSPRDPILRKAFGWSELHSNSHDPLTALLISARARVEAGDGTCAQRRYAEAIVKSPACTHSAAPLLKYFALQGYCDALRVDDFSSEALENLNEASERVRRAREHWQVRQWWDRVQRYKMSLQKSRIQRLQQEAALPNYEATSVSWSDSAWHLQVLLNDAIRLGAPLSVQVDLTEPLLGMFDNDYRELEERLRLNLGKPGEWLNRRLLNGDIFRSRSDSIIRDDMQATADDRREGAKGLGTILFPPVSGGTVETEPSVSSVPISRRLDATLQVMERAAQAVLFKDVPHAITLVEKAIRAESEARGVEALAGLSHVCDWRQVRELMLELPQRTPLDLRRSAQRFPWEHWTICDDFLGEGEKGVEIITYLATNASVPERASVGWALEGILAAVPSNDALINVCAEFSRSILEDGGRDKPRSSDIEVVAAFAAVSQKFCVQVPEAVQWLTDLLERDSGPVRRILLQASDASALRRKAEESLVRGATAITGLRERAHMATLDTSKFQMNWAQVQKELANSWKELPSLGGALRQDAWTTDGWQHLRHTLRMGGHRGKTASWLLARIQLVVEALNHEASRLTLFDETRNGMSFLRSAVIDGIGIGDGIVANQAVYALPALASHTQNDADAGALASGLRAAADDVRIGVAHGAAFVANYLKESGANYHSEIIEAAEEVIDQLSDDALAIVRRQAEFGSKRGSRDASKRNALS